jgi:hypothetical protein
VEDVRVAGKEDGDDPAFERACLCKCCSYVRMRPVSSLKGTGANLEVKETSRNHNPYSGHEE